MPKIALHRLRFGMIERLVAEAHTINQAGDSVNPLADIAAVGRQALAKRQRAREFAQRLTGRGFPASAGENREQLAVEA